jgi:hypothetical protein
MVRTLTDIPGYEKSWLKFSTRVGSACTSVRRISNRFENESDLILQMANRHDVDELSRVVKIPRLAGIRPESCDWSILMVIDHVIRFNDWVLTTIQVLQSGSNASLRSDRLYPDTNIGLDALDDYQEQVWRYTGFIDLQKNLRAGGTTVMPSRQ